MDADFLYDYVVVGAGLFGAAFTRKALDAGKTCLVLEKQEHVGGSIYTKTLDGICLHEYGPHIFHTSSKAIWDFITRFADMAPYVHRLLTRVGEETYSFPLNMYTFQKLWGLSDVKSVSEKLRLQAETEISDPQNFEQKALTLVGRELYETFFKGYTEKQWGKPCRKLPADLLKRVPVRMDYEARCFTDTYQGIPQDGYTRMIERMLQGAHVRTGVDFLKERDTWMALSPKTVYSGALDAYFGFDLGRLPYRSLRFETRRLETADFQGVSVVNYPGSDVAYTRVVEHKHFQGPSALPYTWLTYEYPASLEEGKIPFYPEGGEAARQMYRAYEQKAAACENLIVGGRLGSYRYLNMDQVVQQAFECAEKEGF